MNRRAWLVLMAALVVAACDNGPVGPDTAARVGSVEVIPGELSLIVGDTRTFTATVRAADGTVLDDRTVAWSTTNGSVAEVAASGLVTARASGTALISATVDGKRGQAEVLVAVTNVERVELDLTSLQLEEGDQRQLVATARDQRNARIDGLAVQWMSSSPEIATVSATGEVAAVRVGSTTITASVHGKQASVGVTVDATYPYDLLYTTAANGYGYHEIFRLDIRRTAGSPARLFSPGRWAAGPKLAPDGSRVAFTCWDSFGDPALCIADADGSSSRLLSWSIGEGRAEPTWSPDGTRLALVRTYVDPADGRTRNRIAVVDIENGDLVTLTDDMAGDQITPTWSPRLPDGTERIAFASGTGADRRIWTMWPDGAGKREITTAAGALDAQPAWSPDAGMIVFQRFDIHADGDLWVVDATGGDERRLGPSLAGPQGAPAWSPDGRLIAFVSSHETDGTTNSTLQVYTIWADGTRLARRSFDAGDKASPAWLPRR